MRPTEKVSRRRVQVLGGATAGLLVLSLVGSAATATGSSADPISDTGARITATKAQAAALALQIDAQGRQIEVLAEQYNGARLHADVVNQQLATAAGKLVAAQQQASRAKRALGRQGIEAYIHGGYLSPPTAAPYSGHVDLVVQADYFQLATNSEADAIDQMRVAEHNLAEQRAALQVSQQEARDAVAALVDRQKAVSQANSADQATLAKVQGQLVKLVAQQQALLEAQRIAQEQAALAAQRARAQAAALAAARLAQQQAQALAAAQLAAENAARARQLAAQVTTTVPQAPDGPPVTIPQQPPPTGPPLPPGSPRGAIALAFAVRQLGKPYQWGASGPDSFDCSGLSMRAWEAAGVNLPHFAAAQYADIAHIAIADLQPGDLVFFGSDIHHVGIYAGNGQMIDAPYTGTVVRYDSIFWGDLMGAGRPG